MICLSPGITEAACNDSAAITIQGSNNTYGFLSTYDGGGPTFTTSIPFTPNYGSNPDNFTISVSGEKIQDKNGNAMETDFSSTFSLTK